MKKLLFYLIIIGLTVILTTTAEAQKRDKSTLETMIKEIDKICSKMDNEVKNSNKKSFSSEDDNGNTTVFSYLTSGKYTIATSYYRGDSDYEYTVKIYSFDNMVLFATTEEQTVDSKNKIKKSIEKFYFKGSEVIKYMKQGKEVTGKKVDERAIKVNSSINKILNNQIQAK